ncbi:MAG: hypothetical protein ABEJ27_07010 [Halodesulfurarchaeum sp.]
MVDPVLFIFLGAGILGLWLAVTLYRVLPCWLAGETIEPGGAEPAEEPAHGEQDRESESGDVETTSEVGEDEDEAEPPPAEEGPLATVTPATPLHNPVEMSAFGWMMALGIAFVLIPLWPFIAVLWILGKVGRAGKRRGERHPPEEPPV